nr:hypothetical protein [Sobelivirales sp.]
MRTINRGTTQYFGNPGEDPTCVGCDLGEDGPVHSNTPEIYHGNYVGPGWSDGKKQESVEFGTAIPTDELDALARYHDTAYAHFKDEKHREAADMIFAQEAEKLKRKYGTNWASNPKIASALVLHGNHAKREAQAMLKIAGSGPFVLPALLYHAVSNMVKSHQQVNGTYLKKEMGQVLALYANDPRKMGNIQGGVKPSGDTKPRPPKAQPTGASDGVPKGGSKNPPPPEQPAPKQGPTATQIHNAELIENQRRRFMNYKKLHAAAQRPGPPGRLKKKGIDRRKLGYTPKPSRVVPLL